ncbi:ABC transporter substrate-binding protein [Dactylosporangium sucinum]|uniref:ABC transporter substrate-binding protein n=1 Tax=Dactylosporangium sucinum TaxID=1424081 RepID=A0A917U069_9ACTN|nr:ABC transporter substrate-binding protein [Dactylosporangium sucinum]GGM45740.1 ABC transporter substrate-binding protein [Dactylosporangium sucinum]
MTEIDQAILSRRRFLASLGIITSGVALAPTLAGCDAEPTPARERTPQQGGTLIFGVTSISPYVNPLASTNSRIQWVTDPIVESLYTYDEAGKSVPLLADGEPTVSSDRLTWTIKLKSGVTFSNGDALTAEHVAAVLKFVSNPKSYSDWTSYFGTYVTDAKALDPSTVQISLSKPYGVMRSHLNSLPIVHKDFVAKNDTTVGTGPFKIDKVVQERSVDLVANASYHGTHSWLDGVRFTAVPEPATRLVNLREGRIHVMTDVPPESATTLRADANIQLHSVAAPTDIMTYFVANKPPFNDPRLRKAIAYAMDRKGVRDVVYAGTAQIARGPISPSEEGHNPDSANYGEEPDVAAAKRLMAEAGVDTIEFSLMISNTSNTMKNVGQVLVEGWKKAGIKATLETLDTSAWVTNWGAGKYQLAMTLYESGFGSGHTCFTVIAPKHSAHPLNFGYANPDVDRLMGEAWETQDEAERTAKCKQIDALLADDAIGIPPVYPKFIVAQRTDVTPINEDLMSVGRLKAAPLRMQA